MFGKFIIFLKLNPYQNEAVIKLTLEIFKEMSPQQILSSKITRLPCYLVTLIPGYFDHFENGINFQLTNNLSQINVTQFLMSSRMKSKMSHAL